MTDKAFTHAPKDSGVPAIARDFSVNNRVVIITGAGQGIGREYARQFAAAGAIPIVADISESTALSVLNEIVQAGGRAMAVQVDVGDKDSVDSMVQKVIEEYGRVDVLINNAAVFATLEKRPFDEIPIEEWMRVMHINVTGCFLCSVAVAGPMKAAGWGRIINTSSDAVPLGMTNYLHYVTSKSAITGMTNSLARELGRFGINVNAVRPGAVATEVDRVTNPTLERREYLQSTAQCIPRGQLPQDMVGLVMFLSTQASAFITGQTIVCDGGYTHG